MQSTCIITAIRREPLTVATVTRFRVLEALLEILKEIVGKIVSF
jgi:hypothetical protein